VGLAKNLLFMAYHKKKLPREVRQLIERTKRFEYVTEHYDIEHTELLNKSVDHIEQVEETVLQYNNILRQADKLRDKLNRQTRAAADIHERLLKIVMSLCGRDSIEYQLMGGTRKSNIDYSRKNKQDDKE
jgi:hypothetical protein